MHRVKWLSIITLLLCVLIIQSALVNVNAANQTKSVFNYIIRDPKIVPGGTFRDPMMGEANTLNPLTYSTSWEYMIISVVYDTLVIRAPDGNYVGRLAMDWSVSEDGKVWTFKLYPNATWHDGKPVTAEDVAFTYNYIRDYYNYTRFASYAIFIKEAKVIDNYTVQIELKSPYAPFLYYLAAGVYILPKHIWKDVKPSELAQYKNEPPIGSGPFIFAEHKPQQYYKLVANQKYHLGRPYIDTLLYPIISNADAMLLALKNNEVDVVTWSIPYQTIPQLVTEPNIKLHNVTETGARYAYFNCQRWPMNEVKFRQAVHYAINITEVVNIVYQGYALPGSLGRLPPVLSPWYNENLPPKEKKYPFSLSKAAQLLNELGLIDRNGDGWRDYPNGTTFTLTIYSPSYDPLRVRWGEILSNNLKEIGVKVNYQPLEWTALVNKLNSGDFDILIIGGVGSLDPDILRDIFHTKGFWNNGHCTIPGLDALLEKQANTTDIEARKALVWKIQEILAENVPLLNTVHQQFVFAYRDDTWKGWVLDPLASPDNWFSLMSLYNVKLQTAPTTTITIHPTTQQSATTSVTLPTTIATTPITSPTVTTSTTPPSGADYTLIAVGAVAVIVIVAIALVIMRTTRK